MEVGDAKREPSAVTIKVGQINPRNNRKVIIRKMEMEAIRAKMGFTLFTSSGCASVTRVVGLTPHTPLASMIHAPPVCKIINSPS